MKTTITVTLTLAQADQILQVSATKVPFEAKNMAYLNGMCRIEEALEKACEELDGQQEGLADRIIDSQLERENDRGNYWGTY